MNLLELKTAVNNAVIYAEECNENLESIPVFLQIDGPETASIFSSVNVELHYDNNLNSSGCVLTAEAVNIKDHMD